MTILVAYGSLHVGARIIHRLVRFPQVEFVGQAREADEALVLISSRKPRLVILDLQLSRGTGLDVLRTIIRLQFRSLVMMTSGSSFPQDRRECIKEGADYFFHLPDEIDDLEGIVHQLAKVESA